MKRLAITLLTAVLLLGTAILPAQAQRRDIREEHPVIRVAYPLQPGITDIDEYGNYNGYTYQYLEEVSQYTGWEYEFVQVPGGLDESLDTLMEMVHTGEIDLMGAMLYNETLGEMYDYSAKSYGVVETVLQTLADRALQNYHGKVMRVAVTSQSGVRLEELAAYCEMNVITPEYISCSSTEEQVQAMQENRADVMLNTSFNYVAGVRTVANFAPKPFYFVAGKGRNAELLEELSETLLTIQQINPHYSADLYEKCFSQEQQILVLNEEEQDYLAHAGALRVGVLNNRPPFQQFDSDEGNSIGISVDLLDYISLQTGLTFDKVVVSSETELFQMLNSGDLDLGAGVSYDYSNAREHNVAMTQPYMSAQYVIMMNKSIGEDTLKGKKLALNITSSYKGFFVGEVSYHDSVDACIRAVEAGVADYTYADGYTAQYYASQPQFNNLKLVPQTYTPFQMCFAVSKGSSRNLLSILNKAIAEIPVEDMQAIVYQNTLQDVREITLQRFVEENPIPVIAIVVGVLALVIISLLIILRQRVRMSKKTAIDLKKHLQIYSMADEHFLEYNYNSGMLLISMPSAEKDGQTKLLHYDLSKELEGEGAEWVQALLPVIQMKLDGIHELPLSFDGEEHWARLALHTVYDGDDPVYILGKLNMIDNEKREKDVLMEKAQMDSLTHLYNAETCRKLIEESLSQMREDTCGGFLIMDVDNFKEINDTYGHMEGDAVLKQIASLLQENFRSGDIIGRPGGDEFVVYMKQARDVQGIEKRCQTFCERVREAFPGEMKVTVSMGATPTHKGDGYGRAFRRADKALYLAKEQGRDCFRVRTAGDGT